MALFEKKVKGIYRYNKLWTTSLTITTRSPSGIFTTSKAKWKSSTINSRQPLTIH